MLSEKKTISLFSHKTLSALINGYIPLLKEDIYQMYLIWGVGK